MTEENTEKKIEESKEIKNEEKVAAAPSPEPVKETEKEKKTEATPAPESGKEAGKEKKGKEVKKIKKTEAVARGKDLPISKKHSMEILRFIKGRKIEEALAILQEVLKKKRAIPFRGYEIPHRKGEGIAEGRYPRNASKEFIQLLKSLQANASGGGVDLNKAVLSGKADDASRPYKRGGSMRFKRTHVEIWVREAKEKMIEKKLEKPLEVKK